MIENMSSANIYLNVVARINEDYAELLTHYKEMDTRTHYLRSFEISLSSALPKSLWDIEEYTKIEKKMPLPEDPYAFIELETFRSWITIYELIMRSNGLIGTRDMMIMGME